jgi:hypothetical protein
VTALATPPHQPGPALSPVPAHLASWVSISLAVALARAVGLAVLKRAVETNHRGSPESGPVMAQVAQDSETGRLVDIADTERNGFLSTRQAADAHITLLEGHLRNLRRLRGRHLKGKS